MSLAADSPVSRRHWCDPRSKSEDTQKLPAGGLRRKARTPRNSRPEDSAAIRQDRPVCAAWRVPARRKANAPRRPRRREWLSRALSSRASAQCPGRAASAGRWRRPCRGRARTPRNFRPEDSAEKRGHVWTPPVNPVAACFLLAYLGYFGHTNPTCIPRPTGLGCVGAVLFHGRLRPPAEADRYSDTYSPESEDTHNLPAGRHRRDPANRPA